jgi:hypothetical protein
LKKGVPEPLIRGRDDPEYGGEGIADTAKGQLDTVEQLDECDSRLVLFAEVRAEEEAPFPVEQPDKGSLRGLI